MSLIILLAVLIVPINTFAEEQVVIHDIKQVVIDLQKYRLAEEKAKVYQLKIKNLHEININLEKNTTLMMKQNEVLEKRIKLSDTYSSQQAALLDDLVEMAERQRDMYNLILKEKEPGIIDKLKDSMGKIGIGIVFGAIIVLLV